MAATALVTAVMLLVAGCGAGQSGATAQAPGTPHPSGPPRPPLPEGAIGWIEVHQVPQTPRDAVLAAYERFWQREIIALDTSEVNRREVLAELVTEPALTQMDEMAHEYQRRGELPFGVTRPRATITYFNGAAATITDCADSSGSGALNAANGHRVRVGPARRLILTDLVLESGGIWRIKRFTYPSHSAC